MSSTRGRIWRGASSTGPARPKQSSSRVVRAQITHLVVDKVVLDGDVDGAAGDDDIVAARRHRKGGEREAVGQRDQVLLTSRGAVVAEVADHVVAVRLAAEDERVVSAAAHEHVVAGTPVELVVSPEACQMVVAPVAP